MIEVYRGGATHSGNEDGGEECRGCPSAVAGADFFAAASLRDMFGAQCRWGLFCGEAWEPPLEAEHELSDIALDW